MTTEHNFKKEFGQNFITNDEYIFRAKELLDLKPDDYLLEIGPGDGRFTEEIIKSVSKLDLVEIDVELIPSLQTKFKNYENKLTIYNEDILQFELDKFPDMNYKVFGALPYNISKPIIKKFLEATNKPSLAVFVIQKEVAEDYASKAPRSSFLSNLAHVYSTVEYEFTIPKEFFYPEPKVDGGVLKFVYNNTHKSEESEKLMRFIRNGFRQPRKKLMNNLKSIYTKSNWGESFEKFGINPNARPAELTVENWKNLRTALQILN